MAQYQPYPGYSIDHPLWQDINFTPDWLLEVVTKEAENYQKRRSLLPPSRSQHPSTAKYHTTPVHRPSPAASPAPGSYRPPQPNSATQTPATTPVMHRVALAQGATPLRANDGQAWSQQEDMVLYYCNSPLVEQDGLTMQDIWAVMGRTVMSCKSRWGRMSEKGAGPRCKQSEQQAYAEEGRRLVHEVYKIRPAAKR